MNEQEAISFKLKQCVSELTTALLEKHPRMPGLLREIHQTLKQYPEQVTVLEPEEIAQIVSGLKVQTQTSFASVITKATTAKSVNNKIKTLGINAF